MGQVGGDWVARWFGWDFKVLAASEQLAEKLVLVLVRIKSQIIEAYAIIHFEVECARTHTMIQEHGPDSLCVRTSIYIYLCIYMVYVHIYMFICICV